MRKKLPYIEVAQKTARGWDVYAFQETEKKPFEVYIKKVIEYARQIAAEICTPSSP